MFDRIVRIFKAVLESIVGLIEKKNPIMLANQIVVDMDAKIKTADNAKFEIEARLAIIEDDAKKMRSEATRFENAAIAADAAGDEGLARECAEKYAEFNEKATGLEEQAAELQESVDALSAEIEEAYKNRSQAETQVKLISTQHHVGDAQEAVADALASIDLNDSTSALAKISEDANMKKGRSKAKIAASKKRSGADLEDRVKKLTSGTAGMSALDQIRAKNAPQPLALPAGEK